MGKHRRPQAPGGAFTQVPNSMFEPGGLATKVSAPAAFLFIFFCSMAEPKPNGKPNYGGVQGERAMPYSKVKKRFGWSSDRVKRVIDELLAAGALIRVEHGGLNCGDRVPSVYRVGPAHPWAKQ